MIGINLYFIGVIVHLIKYDVNIVNGALDDDRNDYF